MKWMLLFASTFSISAFAFGFDDDFPIKIGGANEIDNALSNVRTIEQKNGELLQKSVPLEFLDKYKFDVYKTESGRTYFDSLSSWNKYITQTCNDDLDEGASTQVKYLSFEKCTNIIYYYKPVNYIIQKQNNNLHIKVNARLNFDSGINDNDYKKIFNVAKSCANKIRNYIYSKDGFYYDLSFDSNRENSHPKLNASIAVKNEIGGTNTFTLYYQGHANRQNYHKQYPQTIDDDFCLVMFHEFSHLIGLNDEYKDSYCTQRTTVRDYSDLGPSPISSVMDNQYAGWGNIDYYPSHIKQFFMPICGGILAPQDVI